MIATLSARSTRSHSPMETSKGMHVIFGLSAWFGVAAFLIWQLLMLDTFQNSYANYNDMMASEEYLKGWIPDVIPRSATRIRETHDLDLNSIDIAFEYKPSAAEVDALWTCKPIEAKSEGSIFRCPPYTGSENILSLAKNGTGHYSSRRVY